MKLAASGRTLRTAALVLGALAIAGSLTQARAASTFRLDGDARWADISSDGDLVVFESNASNLVKPALKPACPAGREHGDVGRIVLGICQHVYVRDVSTNETKLVAEGRHPLIPGNGRYVAYESGRTDIRGDTQKCSSEGLNGRITYNCPDVLIRDLINGETERVSLLPDGSQPKADSSLSWISPEGKLVAFGVRRSGAESQLYLWDRTTGRRTEVVGATGAAALSRDGRFVAFNGYDKTLTPGDRRDCSLQDCQDIILLDRSTGRTKLVSKTFSGQAPNGPNFRTPSISEDGRFVAFWSEAKNLLPGNKKTYPQGPGPDVYVYDAASEKLTLVSVSLKGGFGNGFSGHPRITPDGRYVTFFSDATDLVLGDAKPGDVYVRDLVRRKTFRISVSSSGEPGNNISTCCGDPPAISADGNFVAFSSAASNLAPSNEAQEGVFLRDVKRGTTVLASVPVTRPQDRRVIVGSEGSRSTIGLIIGIGSLTAIVLSIVARRRRTRGKKPAPDGQTKEPVPL